MPVVSPVVSPEPSSSWRGRDMAVALLLLLSLGATAPYFGRLMNANERPRVLQAIAWVDEAELAVDGPAVRGIDPGIDVARSPVDGRLYPNKPPGATVPAVIAYAGLRGLAAVGGPEPTLRSLTITARVLGGLLPTVVLLLLLLRRLRARGAGATGDAAVVLLALATPLTVYGRLLYGHALAACLLMAGMLLVLDGTDPDRPTTRRAFAGGALAASAIIVEYAAAFAGLPLALLLVVRLRAGAPRAPLLAAALGALLPIAALGGYHAMVFGSPWSTGYHHVVDAGFAKTHAQGLLGLGLPTTHSLFEHLLSPWGGLLVWAPLVGVALVVTLWRWRTLDTEERLAAGTLLLLTVIVVSLAQTGGWRVGPRYLVLVMPLSVYGLVHSLDASRRRPVLAVAMMGVALASATLCALAANLFPHLVPHGNPWADLLLPLASRGHMSYSILPGASGSSSWALALVVGIPVGLVGWSLVRCLVPRESVTSWWRPMAGMLGLGAGLAVLLLVALLGLPEHPQASGDLAAVQSIWEPDGPRPARVQVLAPLPE